MMIAWYDRQVPKDAGREFKEWASHLNGGLFVMLEVYADESGTHDEMGKEVCSEVAVIGGYIASTEEWADFSDLWQFLLDAYRIPFFHFREYNLRRRHPDDSSNPYHHLDDDQLEFLLYDL